MTIWTINIILVLTFQMGITIDSNIKEVMTFCQNNGHKFVAISHDGKNNQFKRDFIYSSYKSDLRGKIVNDFSPFIFTLETNVDTLIIWKNDNKFNESLNAVHQNKILKSIIVLKEDYLQNLMSALKVFALNAYFYVLVLHASSFTWYSVMTLNNSPQIIMKKLEFDENNQIIQNYKLDGINVVGTAANWMPYYSGSNCDKDNLKCENIGIMSEMVNGWSQELNFTWDVRLGTDWGSYPVSGKHWSSKMDLSFNSSVSLRRDS